jgi:PAS domain S-box-containing protein
MRQQGFSDYRIYPEGERDLYTSIIYLEPFNGRNLRAFGYDMYSNVMRRMAMEKSRDEGHAVISGKVKLLQESDDKIQAGFLMYLPVYRENKPVDTLLHRREAIVGWVYEPFRMDDFMIGLSSTLITDIAIEIYDDKTLASTARMFDSDGQPNSCELGSPKINRTEYLNITDHIWTLRLCSTPALESRLDNQKSQIIAMMGSGLSLLLALLVWQLASSNKQALELAKKITAELTETESRFRLMADSAPVLIWVAGLDKKCFWFNKVWLDFTGRTLEEEMGDGWADGVHAEDLQRCLDHYVSHFDLQQAFSMEYRLKRYDGEYRWILDSGIPRFDQDGHFAGFIGSCIDITERKHIEAALLRSNADLTRFAEVSAHHLMEPTRRLNSYTQRLAKQLSALNLDQELAEQLNLDLHYLQADANRLHTMLHDIQLYLAASQPRGQMQLEDANIIVSQLQKQFLPTLQTLKTTISTESLPPAFLDRPRLLDLFGLIIDNALRHGRPRDPFVTGQIKISGERIGKLSRYRISDNGSGIPPEYQERIFIIFERLTHNGEAGSGIGLAIARRIVESRHGRIWIENAPQTGTCVVFELPDGEI